MNGDFSKILIVFKRNTILRSIRWCLNSSHEEKNTSGQIKIELNKKKCIHFSVICMKYSSEEITFDMKYGNGS
jgi:hypothetical protein